MARREDSALPLRASYRLLSAAVEQLPSSALGKLCVLQTNENLPQLYRFCFLMTGDSAKAQEAFQNTLRAAAAKAAQGEPAPDRLWFFRDARWQSLIASESGLQPEPGTIEEADLQAEASKQIGQLTPEQLAIWISGAPEPQRAALAAYYLDEFSLSEMQLILELRASELSELLTSGRRQFQAWLNATVPIEVYENE